MSSITKILFVKNPLIKRYSYSVLRPSQFWIYLTIYIAVVALLLFINYSSYKTKTGADKNEEFYNNVYYQLIVLQVITLWIWAAINSKSALTTELSDKTYDFFRLLPLSAMQKTTGILLGRNLLPILFAAINVILTLVFGFLGKRSISLQLQVILLLISSSLFINTLALLSSSTTVKKRGKTSIIVWILFLFFAGPLLLRFIFLPTHQPFGKNNEVEIYPVKFYNIEIPILLFITLVCLYMSLWNILGILRKFTFETEPIFSRKGAFLYLLGYEFIVIGLFMPHLSDKTIYPFWLVSLIPVVFTPVGSIKSYDHYLECCGLRGGHSDTGKSMTSILFLNSNLTLAVGLFFVWVIFSVLMAMIGKADPSRYIFNIVIIFSFYFFLLLLLELYVVYNPIYNKIAILLVFLTILYLFLPLLLYFTLDIPSLCFYSPIGFFAQIIEPFEGKYFVNYTSILIVNAILCVIPACLISKRYFYILALRRKM